MIILLIQGKINNKECRIEIFAENNIYQIFIPECNISLQFTIIKNTLITVIIDNHIIFARHVDLMRLKKILGGQIFYSSISKFYKSISNIKEGNCSQIIKVQCYLTQKYYAAKCIPKTNNDNSNILEEIRIMKILQHQNIVKVEEVYESHHTIYIIMELLDKQIIDEYDHNDIKSILYQLFIAIKYLHSKQIVHSNISLANLMLDQNNVLKLIDFGSSKDLSTNHKKENHNTQVLREIEYKNDLFKAGVVMYNLYSREHWILENDKLKIHSSINQQKSNIPTIADKGTELLQSLLEIDSQNKMTIDDILNHYYFQENRNNYIEYHQSIIPTFNPKFKQELINKNYQSSTYIPLTDRNQKFQSQSDKNLVLPFQCFQKQ